MRVQCGLPCNAALQSQLARADTGTEQVLTGHLVRTHLPWLCVHMGRALVVIISTLGEYRPQFLF